MKNLTTLALLWLLALVPALAQTPFEARAVPAFTALEVSSGIELNLRTGPTPHVEVSADTPEHQARIKTEVRAGVLHVSFERPLNEAWSRKPGARPLRVNVTAPPLTALGASSGAAIVVAGAYAPAKLHLSLSSGGTISAELTAPAVEADLSSGGVATLTGKTQRLEVESSSGGVFRGSGLLAATCAADASSGGIIHVAVAESLRAGASSGGNVRYSGSPQVMKNTSSGGSVKSR